MSEDQKPAAYKTFTDEELLLLAEIIKTKTKNAGCPLCGGRNFVAASLFIMTGLERSAPGNTLNNVTTPTLRLFCANCGYALLLSSVLLGITDLKGNLTLSSHHQPADSKKPVLTLICCDPPEPPT